MPSTIKLKGTSASVRGLTGAYNQAQEQLQKQDKNEQLNAKKQPQEKQKADRNGQRLLIIEQTTVRL